jgi:hypothetical protein
MRWIDCAAQRDIRALACHAVILSGAKNLALDFSAEKQQGEMVRAPQRAQHDRPENSIRWCIMASRSNEELESTQQSG